MRQSDAIKVLNRWDVTGRYVYLKRDLRKLFHSEARERSTIRWTGWSGPASSCAPPSACMCTG